MSLVGKRTKKRKPSQNGRGNCWESVDIRHVAEIVPCWLRLCLWRLSLREKPSRCPQSGWSQRNILMVDDESLCCTMCLRRSFGYRNLLLQVEHSWGGGRCAALRWRLARVSLRSIASTRGGTYFRSHWRSKGGSLHPLLLQVKPARRRFWRLPL